MFLFFIFHTKVNLFLFYFYNTSILFRFYSFPQVSYHIRAVVLCIFFEGGEYRVFRNTIKMTIAVVKMGMHKFKALAFYTTIIITINIIITTIIIFIFIIIISNIITIIIKPREG